MTSSPDGRGAVLGLCAYTHDSAAALLLDGQLVGFVEEERLTGAQALSFVRFRHTDDDYHRLARQQQFVRAFKEQVSQDRPSVGTLLKIISVITHNVEVGSKKGFDERTVVP